MTKLWIVARDKWLSFDHDYFIVMNLLGGDRWLKSHVIGLGTQCRGKYQGAYSWLEMNIEIGLLRVRLH